jgi:hypothetical protein
MPLKTKAQRDAKMTWINNRLKDARDTDLAIGLAVALFALAIYAFTAMPSVPAEDAGEIAASLHSLGIVHPTGYPLFTLMGHAWLDFTAWIPGHRAIERLNLLMATLGATTVFFLYVLLRVLLRESFPDTAGIKAASGAPSRAGLRVAAAGGALALAFSRMAWTNAGSLEVYALHLLFLPLLTLLFLKSMPRGEALPNAGQERMWNLFAYALGLSFSNHMMTVLLAPGFLFLFFVRHRAGFRAWARIARAIPPFALGLSAYLYLPLRAAAKPLLNWGDPETWTNFVRHVSAAQYRFNMFRSMDVATEKSAAFFRDLPSDFGYAPLALAAVGLVALARRARLLFVFSLLLFAVAAIYEANYDFPDPNFRLNAHFVVALWSGLGIFAAARVIAARARFSTTGAALLLGALTAAAPLFANFSGMNRHDDYAVEDYARNVLASADSGAVLLTDEEWTVFFPALYLQQVEGFRTDVAVLHTAVVLIPWHLEYLRRTHPEILAAAPEETSTLAELSRFATDTRADERTLVERAARWEAALLGLLRKNAPLRPVHSTFVLFLNDKRFGNVLRGYPALPVGMTFRLFADSLPSTVIPMKAPVFHPVRRQNETGVKLNALYADAYYNHGVYQLGFRSDTASAVGAFLKAQELVPGHAMSRAVLINLGVWR